MSGKRVLCRWTDDAGVVHQEWFDADELEVVPPPTRPCVAKSGGPVMELECVEGENAICSWDRWDETGGATVRERKSFLLAGLYQCVPMTGAKS